MFTNENRKSSQVRSRGSANSREQVRRRQLLTVVFAVALVLIAGVSHAQTPAPISNSIQYDSVSAIESLPPPSAVIDRSRVAGGAVATNRLMGDARPAYVEVHASLSNFDADADPDGWRVELVLRDRKDRPVVMRGNANFELMPRVPTADYM